MHAIYLRHMGDDLSVVNNARVSFQKTGQWDELTNELKASDQNLIRYLARGITSDDMSDLIDQIRTAVHLHRDDILLEAINKYRKTPIHWAPFANGTTITFHVKAPIPIMRQLFKHKVGAVESEVSRRYIDSEPEFFEPAWRHKAENVKQGSGAEMSGTDLDIRAYDQITGEAYDANLDCWYHMNNEASLNVYNNMIKNGVCAEQARFVLPQSMYSEAIISQSLYGWANVYNHRADASHAQKEISDLVMDMARQIAPLYPISWAALTS